ncbi:putative catalase protein [Neofusicoccum parvum]|uniref:Putative catalase protein n=1 Tax=Botryosphaeria parva (strain UCR-NP2) TaxID=1287680 RepID=R1GI08_BOTPV|nr:putative catalase protein [Neofusicoccum parvum UCRNP2]GME37772.1 putative catalase protein [Neofusicoccum parvum]
MTAEDLARRNYVRWDADGVEQIPPNEAEDIQAVADMINKIQRTHFNNARHAFGGTHARTQGVVKGNFIVSDDLPKHLKQTELFEKGGEYPVVCRYSSEPGDPGLDDRIPQPRGFSMKLFNVHGKMFDAGADFPTQDIEFNSTPALDLADAKTTRDIIDLRIKYGGNKPELYKHLEARQDTDLQKARDSVRNTHLESTRQYSQTAYRFGDYVIKYSLVPSSETQKKLYEETVKPADGSDILHRWLQAFHRDHDAEYLFQVQFCENLEDQPVEYAGTAWDPEKYPWQTVAKLVIPKQDSFDYERKTFWEDHMRVDPWHGLVSLQPLGSPNRLRRVVYPASSGLRRKMNGRKEINVKSIDEIP